MARKRSLDVVVVIIMVVVTTLMVLFWFGISPTDVRDFVTQKERVYNQNIVVQLDPEVDAVLSSLYQENTDEFVRCMYGETFVGEVHITNVRETAVVSANESSITYEPCRKTADYLGSIHSHPRSFGYTSCQLSVQDGFTYAVDEGDIVGVICGPGRYGFYNQASLEDSYEYRVIA